MAAGQCYPWLTGVEQGGTGWDRVGQGVTGRDARAQGESSDWKGLE